MSKRPSARAKRPSGRAGKRGEADATGGDERLRTENGDGQTRLRTENGDVQTRQRVGKGDGDEPLAETKGEGEGEKRPKAKGEEGAVLITGICGRLGRLLTRQLHRRGAVVGIDRRPFEGKPEDVVHHQLDLRRKRVREVFRGTAIRAVVHLGTMHNLRESDREHHTWNVVGFQKVLEYVATYRIPKLVVLSSANIYGPSPDNPHFLTEDAPLSGAQEFSQIRDLVEVDMLAQSFFWKTPSTETVILRPCHILGMVRNAASNYLRLKRPLTVMGFDPTLQVIHERDVVEAIMLALSPGAVGIFNLRGPGEMPLSRILAMLGKSPRPLPGPVAKGVLRGLWAYRAGSYPPAEIEHVRYLCMVDDTRAREQLGFRPRHDMRETLQAVYSEV